MKSIVCGFSTLFIAIPLLSVPSSLAICLMVIFVFVLIYMLEAFLKLEVLNSRIACIFECAERVCAKDE